MLGRFTGDWFLDYHVYYHRQAYWSVVDNNTIKKLSITCFPTKVRSPEPTTQRV